MARRAHSLALIQVVLLWAIFGWPGISATRNPPFLEQGFYFDYNIPGQPVPIPTTAQCDTIHLEWSRGAATGPNPTAPYYLLIYTSTFIVPFSIAAGTGLTFDWQVPFAPGTQYQICMFDTNGVTGGCQAIYTVIPTANATASSPPSCPNVTFPAGAMDVVGGVHNGPFSQYGWVDQCTDLSVTPKNGTPPYTLTIAPTLHPPVNITSRSMGSINWTVTLSWASPFFISLVDSEGNGWANGPLHSGGGGPTDCLALGDRPNNVPMAAAIGAGVGALALGIGLALAGAFFFNQRRTRRAGYDAVTLRRKSSLSPAASPDGEVNRPLSDSMHYGELSSTGSLPAPPREASQIGASSSSRGSASTAAQTSLMHRLGHGEQYHIEPFVLPSGSKFDSSQTEAPTSLLPASSSSTQPPVPQRNPAQPTSDVGSAHPPAPSSSGSASSRQQASQVYVVHHDGGRAPVTVFTPDGTEVVELPPRYTDTRDGESPRQQRRQPGPARKPASARQGGEPVD